MIRQECSYVFEFFNAVWGEGTAKKVFGTKVLINSKDEKSGKIEIEYYSQDELDRIIDLIRTIQ